MAASDLTAERVRHLLDYDSEQGIFYWRNPLKAKVRGQVAGGVGPKGYKQVKVDGFRYLSHRLAWLHVHGEWPKGQIDHINGVRHDNRISNLRDVTPSVNNQNQRRALRNNATGLLGVSRTSSGKPYAASIGVAGKYKWLGTFDTPEEASQAYIEAKRSLHPGGML